MGCDIHLCVEVRKDENSPWKAISKMTEWEDSTNYMTLYWAWVWRDYDLFSILADVRNYNDLTAISDPRGMPEDVSSQVLKEIDYCDGHSHSYFSLSELKEFDWGQSQRHTGIVSLEQYEEFKAHRMPYESYSRGISGPGITIINEEEADKILDGTQARKADIRYYYVRAQWEEIYMDTARDFLQEVMPALEALGEEDNVRIVFWFDN